MIQAVKTVIRRASGPLLASSLALMSGAVGSAHAQDSAAPNTCIDAEGREIYVPTGETIDQTIEVVGKRLPEPAPLSPALTHAGSSSSRALSLMWPLLLLFGLYFARGRLAQRRTARPM